MSERGGGGGRRREEPEESSLARTQTDAYPGAAGGPREIRPAIPGRGLTWTDAD